MEELECLNGSNQSSAAVSRKCQDSVRSRLTLGVEVCNITEYQPRLRSVLQVVCAVVSAVSYLCIGLVRSWASTAVPRYNTSMSATFSCSEYY